MIDKNKTYIPLHVHDTYGSINDSILKIPDFVKKLKELGIPSAAITNHGSMSTFVTFYEECMNNDINPIIGCEFYLCDDIKNKDKKYYHLILLAKNYNGLKNLIFLHNKSQQEGFYYKPKIDLKNLETHTSDLICLTACISGPIGYAFSKENDHEKALSYFETLKHIFDDDLYLEIQPGYFREQIAYNDFLVAISRNYDVKLVATNDIHYLNKEDYFAHNLHIKDLYGDTDIHSLVYPDTCYYLMDKDELYNSFCRTSYITDDIVRKSLENTVEIANKCHLEIPSEQIMPVFNPNMNEDAVLESICKKSLQVKHLNQKKYKERLAYELDTIKTLGFSGYFLIVKDIIDFCDNNKIPRGPGRGSCAGSLVSYLLNISVADPIKYDLMFERFLSKNRSGWPDIDLDLSPTKRDEVYRHIISKYGKDYCCFVSTFQMRKAKNAIRAACRILEISSVETNIISSKIPYVSYDECTGEKICDISLKDAYENISDFREICDKHPNLYSIASSLEGYPFAMGIHPAGIVISPVNISSRYPLIHRKDSSIDIMATSLDLHDVEKLSGIKFDLLGLSSLDVIHKTMEDVGITFDFNNDKIYEDEDVWKLISSKNSSGLFQISSDTYGKRMPQLHPTNIEELAACLALLRGPCISSGMDKIYIDIINGVQEEEHIHDVYWEATKNTHGVLIYQEQILKICMNVGFDSETAYKILKAVSKKKIDLIKSYKEEFYKHAREKMIYKQVADRIWQRIEDSGLYAFNIAHAISYALVCYQSAYLKCHYPVQYMCNVLTKEAGQNNKTEILQKILNECKSLGIEFLLPDINRSEWNFTIEDNKIRVGFCTIKGVGESVFNKIKEAGSIRDFNDFIKRVSGRVVNRKPILIMIAAGMFSNLESMHQNELASMYIEDIRKEGDWNGNILVGKEQINLKEANYEKLCKTILGSDLYCA